MAGGEGKDRQGNTEVCVENRRATLMLLCKMKEGGGPLDKYRVLKLTSFRLRAQDWRRLPACPLCEAATRPAIMAMVRPKARAVPSSNCFYRIKTMSERDGKAYGYYNTTNSRIFMHM